VAAQDHAEAWVLARCDFPSNKRPPGNLSLKISLGNLLNVY
jgi:hypothetical protein